jgi:hypothetical protein
LIWIGLDWFGCRLMGDGDRDVINCGRMGRGRPKQEREKRSQREMSCSCLVSLMHACFVDQPHVSPPNVAEELPPKCHYSFSVRSLTNEGRFFWWFGYSSNCCISNFDSEGKIQSTRREHLLPQSSLHIKYISLETTYICILQF